MTLSPFPNSKKLLQQNHILNIKVHTHTMITLTHTIRCKSSLSLSYNHNSHLFNNPFETNPLLVSSSLSSKCSCYSCCYLYSSISICNRLAPINPSFLCKNLIFSGNNFRVLSFYDVDRTCNEKVCDFRERKKQGKRVLGCNRRKRFSSNVSDECGYNVDVMLSLLSGEAGSEYVDVRKINKGKNNAVKIRALAKSKNLDLRKEGFDGEKEFEVKCDGYMGQTSSSEYKNDLKTDCKSRVDEVVGNIENREEFVEERGKILAGDDTEKGYYGKSIGVSRDWRKTSEKKLNGEYMDEVDKAIDESGSRMKCKRFTEMSDNDKSVIELVSSSAKELKPISEVSERRMKRLEENSTEVDDKIKNTREEKHHNENEISKEILGISDTHFTNSENNSISLRKEFRMTKQKQYLPVRVTKGKKSIIEDNNPSSEIMEVGCGLCGPKGGGSSHSSQGSVPKGPSDEMWHVTDASTQDSSETNDAPELDNISDLSETGEAVQTSSRSFWTVIGDVVRSNWKSPWSESLTPNSGSETWFSSTKCLDSPLTSSNNNSGISTSLPIIKESSENKKTLEAGETVKSGYDPKNGELKRRSLVHRDQVFKDRFGEWEDAYNLENEQQKNDEMFMREALLEAKKAADVWEVPVGAVLVKGGKIISRGYNLVEELRDSTAHAEMICIRKASTNLQSWRLSDTTLYVTLEPCPMCAGAILQARIDTVVWGAPNKLLGADGSWIRLFCDGDGGNDSMPTSKPPAPTHPFHLNMAVRRGVLAAECSDIMRNFFRLRRKMKTEPKPETEPEPKPPTPPSSIIVSHHHHHRNHSDFFSKIHHIFKIIFCL